MRILCKVNQTFTGETLNGQKWCATIIGFTHPYGRILAKIQFHYIAQDVKRIYEYPVASIHNFSHLK